jgi:adenylylsulfate kinase
MSDPESKSTASTNIKWHHGELDEAGREKLLGGPGCVVWFTGLSGSGKSTVARRVERRMLEAGARAYVLDGDNLRHGLNGDLGFSPDDRAENIRRVGEVARLMADAGLVVLSAFVSPYAADRNRVRALVPSGRFIEVFVDTPLEVCEARDPKGLYKKARAGVIADFTGISAPYEAPVRPEVHLKTHGKSIDACAVEVVEGIRARGYASRT